MSTRTAPKKAFGARFRAVRLEKGFTYQAIAKLLGISVPMILKYERGFSFPTVETLILMSQRLEVSLDALLGLNVYEIKRRPRPPE